jgi:hypothetical protein
MAEEMASAKSKHFFFRVRDKANLAMYVGIYQISLISSSSFKTSIYHYYFIIREI